MLYSHLHLALSSGLFPSGFPQNPVNTSPLSHTCYVPAHHILLDFITRTIMGEEYRSLNSSLCSFLYSPVTSSLLGPNTLLYTLFSNTPQPMFQSHCECPIFTRYTTVNFFGVSNRRLPCSKTPFRSLSNVSLVLTFHPDDRQKDQSV